MSAVPDLLRGPAFEVVARRRPVGVVQPGTVLPGAPCAGVERTLEHPAADAVVGLTSGGTSLRAHRERGRVRLEVEHDGLTTEHRSRRLGRVDRCDALALALTGDRVTALTREAGRWTARAVLDLGDRVPAGPDVHDEAWLADLRPVDGTDASGCFGQLGLRDPRVVSHADGTPVTDGGRLLLTATSAGPGGFRTGHSSVWSLDPVTLDLAHRADLFFRRTRPDGRPGVLGDHATHLVRDGDAWLVATSTWGDFDQVRNPRVGVVVARTGTDLLSGSHVLDTEPLALPTLKLNPDVTDLFDFTFDDIAIEGYESHPHIKAQVAV